MSNSTPTILVNGEVADQIIARGMSLLRGGASALDVAEQIARDVEDDVNDHSVGFSGLPNVIGDVELDASFMDGRSLRVGAVGAIGDFRHPISIARAVMEKTPHVLLVGAGAERFAGEIGAERRSMLTPEASAIWRDRVAKVHPEKFGFVFNGDRLVPAPGWREGNLIGLTARTIEFREGGDTMNVMVMDASGNIVSAVTTSGIAWKYPGRLGDSPVPGAGNYADSRFGAAAAMGLGELTMRHGTSVRAVMMLQQGMSLQAVGESVSHDIIALQAHVRRGDSGMSSFSGAWIRTVIMDAAGNCGGFSTAEYQLDYKVMRLSDDAPVTHACWNAKPGVAAVK